jgi:undecaprenyl diphosphate synthase
MTDQTPRHVAIIMDGNGRWAQHARAAAAFRPPRGRAAGASDIVRACPISASKYLTIFAFSTENWKRTQTEVAGLMSCSSATSGARRRRFLRRTACACASSATACGWKKRSST